MKERLEPAFPEELGLLSIHVTIFFNKKEFVVFKSKDMWIGKLKTLSLYGRWNKNKIEDIVALEIQYNERN